MMSVSVEYYWLVLILIVWITVGVISGIIFFIRDQHRTTVGHLLSDVMYYGIFSFILLSYHLMMFVVRAVGKRCTKVLSIRLKAKPLYGSRDYEP